MPIDGYVKLVRVNTSGSTCALQPATVIKVQTWIGSTQYMGVDLLPFVGNLIRIYQPGFNGCWYVDSTSDDLLLTHLLWPLGTPFSDYGTFSGNCQDCKTSVILEECAAGGLVLIYGATAQTLKTTYVGQFIKSLFEPNFPVCAKVLDPDNVFSDQILAIGGMDPPLDFGTFAFTIPNPNNCATCQSTAKCIRLTDCATNGGIFDYYIENNDILPIGPPYLTSLVGGTAQLTIPVTMINEVTGLPEAQEFTSCFNILSSNLDPGGSPGCSKHSVTVVAQADSCPSCGYCFDLFSCDTPGENYTVHTTLVEDEGELYNLLVQCISGCPGCQPTIKIDLQDGQGFRCFRVALSCGDFVQINLDPYAPLVYQLYCDANPCVVCVTEPICYQVTFCNGQTIILQDPTLDGGGVIPLGNYYSGNIELVSEVLNGCFTISQVACGSFNPAPVTGATIVLGSSPLIAYADCTECEPGYSYRLTRCDDEGVYFIVSNFGVNIDPLVGYVIRNITLANCSTGTTPCVIKPEQCWRVSLDDPSSTLIALVDYDTRTEYVYPPNDDTDMCQCCLDDTYIPET